MIRTIVSRIRQGMRTVPFPFDPEKLPDRFAGFPSIQPGKCPENCQACRNVCPTACIEKREDRIGIDLGACIFCQKCERACPEKAIRFTREYRMSAATREEMIVTPEIETMMAAALDEKLRSLFGRSLKLRQVSAGGCNACEADINVLNTPAWDLNRFGIQIVASPRHADGLLVTGPVTKNMETALRKTYEALALPRIVIAVGACAVSGGVFRDSDETCGGTASTVPVDLFIPGCPPHPSTILYGMLKLLDKVAKP
jgi:Ni,Fe-hydrogenase III small subunit/NAD-dependent dihydropyrimidine dehydrogenase PreA subunit